MPTAPKPLVLIILDGWGYSESPDYNAIAKASKPIWDHLWSTCPSTLIRTSGVDVGLPADQMGNSEVGHINIGAGRVVYQEATRIGRSIKTGSFFENATLTKPLDEAIAQGKAVHILGLLSPGGVHSDEEHIHAMLRMAVERGATKVYLHVFTDGRDTPPRSAISSVQRMQAVFDELGTGCFASVIGRYYAMDRDNRWERTQQAYKVIVCGEAEYTASTAEQAVNAAYARDESDEFIKATSILTEDGKTIRVDDGDVMFFMNFRADRARQLARSFIDEEFSEFKRSRTPKLEGFISLTEFSASFDIPAAFPPERLENVIGQYIANRGFRQLRLAETEKYAHVTFFFNGGTEDVFEGEERILVQSPRVATYDLQPEMSASEVTDHLVEAILGGKQDMIICNYANTDMVGHTGNVEAAIKAVETLDKCLGRVTEALHSVGGEALITADHGNAELLFDEKTGQPHTAHTTNPVPLIYFGRTATLLDSGVLSDIAPTMLSIMELEQPREMTGRPLIEFTD